MKKNTVKSIVSILMLLVPFMVSATESNPYISSVNKLTQGQIPQGELVDMGGVDIQKPHLITNKNREMTFIVGSNGAIISGVYINKDGLNISSLMHMEIVKEGLSKINKGNSLTVGDGKVKVYMFTDPDCPACRNVEQIFDKYKKLVKDVSIVHVFFPLKNIHPNAERDVQRIWCSDDKAKTMYNIMVKKMDTGSRPDKCNKYPVDAMIKLGDSIGVHATPTLFAPDGSIIDLRRLSDKDTLYSVAVKHQ